MHEVDRDGQRVWRRRPRQPFRHGIRVEHVAVGPVGHVQQRRRRRRTATTSVHFAHAAHDGMRSHRRRRRRRFRAPAWRQTDDGPRQQHVLRAGRPSPAGGRQLFAAVRQGRVAVQRQEDQGPGENQNGVHREQAAQVHDVLQEENRHHEKGEWPHAVLDPESRPERLTGALCRILFGFFLRSAARARVSCVGTFSSGPMQMIVIGSRSYTVPPIQTDATCRR